MHPNTGAKSARIKSVRALPDAVLRGDTNWNRHVRTRGRPPGKEYRESVRERRSKTVTPGTTALPSSGGVSSTDPQKVRIANRIQKGRIQPDYPSSSGNAADDRGEALVDAGAIVVVLLEHDGQERLPPAAEKGPSAR